MNFANFMNRLWGVHHNSEKLRQMLIQHSDSKNPKMAMLAQSQLLLVDAHREELRELIKELYAEGID